VNEWTALPDGISNGLDILRWYSKAWSVRVLQAIV